MKIKLVKRTGDESTDKNNTASAFAALVAEGYSANNISVEVIDDFTYDAFSAGGSQESLELVSVLIAKA